jgi:methionyl-tRNA formyltransferase
MRKRIVIATPHRRFDGLEARVAAHPGLEVRRIRDKDDLTVEALQAFDPAYVFFPQWSWKIPAEVYDRFRAVIFHMTDLPFGRGGSPLQNLVVRGFEETRLSALQCVAEMDAGPIYAKRPLSLHGTAEEILMRAADAMEAMIVDIAVSEPRPEPQQGEPVAFRRRKPEEGALDGAVDLKAVFDHIRMLDGEGYPNAFLDVGPFRLEFSRASLRPDAVLADVRFKLREE